MHDVVVVGAGPAGLHAARRLSQRGFDVVVVEEHQTVGRPVHCTGILARKAFAEFELPTSSILNPLETARFVSPAGRSIVYRPARSEAVVIDRGMFDAQLAEQARAAGARFLCETRVVGLAIDSNAASIATSAGATIRGRACVLACGGRYALHRQLGLSRPETLLHTAQAELPAASAGDVELHFGAEAAPQGFAWAVPVIRSGRSFVRVGVMCQGRAPHYFNRMVERLGRQWGVSAEEAPVPVQKILPLSAVARTYGDRLLVAGDAAGLVKPTTGGGIYYSLLSATLAADVLSGALAREDLGSAALAEYERRWRAHLHDELTTQLALRVIAQRMSDHDIESLFELALTDGIMPIVRRTASFNWHRKLILALFEHPPARQIFFRSKVS